MTKFEELLGASPERLVNIFYAEGSAGGRRDERLARTARRLGLNRAQLICALGFNPAIGELADILSALGFADYEELARKRNEIFMADIYNRLAINDVLAIYATVRNDEAMVDVMQYLLRQRLENVEKRIEATVNSVIIERYKKEMRAIYNDGIARIDFAEARLNRTESGFRALVNEVNIITEAKIIPVGDIFFRNTVLPQEKRKLIVKGLIPDDLIRSRLADRSISEQERRMLEEFVRPAR
ncbi:MAG: hypothetical protein IT495_04360 [Gammaproteobacteria bacterium]|nr:hypothetical protein [Gammaproteobacteria bacterium]